MTDSGYILDFILNRGVENLPAKALSQAKICLMDLLGTGFGASPLSASEKIRTHSYQHFAERGQGARILFDGRKASATGAALAGAMTIDGLDCHDGQALTKGHVGCAILPAILAFYEDLGLDRSGPELLADIVVGYEIGTRLGIALHATTTDYHTSGAWNAVTCAGLGARLMHLDQKSTRHALGIAEYHGPRSQMMRVIDHPSMLKDGSGWGAMAGVSAAYLAKDGFTGAPAILIEDDAVQEVFSDLGERWYILEQYFKPYPVCRWAQPSITAALNLKAEYEFEFDEIETVRAHTFHQGIRLYQGLPKDTEQAQYGIVFPLAAALKFSTIGPEQISGKGLSDPDVIALCSRISLHEEESYNEKFPAERWAHIEITLKDGRLLTSPPTKAAGDPDTPIKTNVLASKFLNLASPHLGGARAAQLLDLISKIDSQPHLENLNSYLY